ncbi:hypothetical protein [Enemella sp. A6]|uniref:hypothetical protein n=1 Tax=Enemella sp. A6 TaxID=3440152 RepID=UPI003EBC2D74
MNAALIVLSIVGMLVTLTALAAAVAGVRRMAITARAHKALPGSNERPGQVLWQVREVSESPHLRFVANKDMTDTDLAMIKVEETLSALPPGHRQLAKMQADQLVNARAVRGAVVENLSGLPEATYRDLADGVSKGLVQGMSAKELPAGHKHVRKAITSGKDTQRPLSTTGTALVPAGDPVMNQIHGWLRQFGVAGRSLTTSSTFAQLADMGLGLAQEMLNWGRPGGASPEARRLVDAMEDLGELVTPAYLWQVTEYSETALQNATAAVHRMETELAASKRGEAFRRTWWPSVGDKIAEDALAHGRQVLTQEHQAHRRLTAAMEEIAVADPKVRGTVWALMLRDVPEGAIDGPDLRAFTPTLDAYLATRRGRR